MIHKTTAMSLAGVAAFCLGMGSASASDVVASIGQVSGSALVNQGQTYEPVVAGASLHEGSRLMTMEGGSITVQFQDGCTKELTENQVMTVGAADSCSTASLTTQGEGSYHAAMAPATAGLGFVAAAAAVVVIGGAGLDLGSDDRRDPLPPISP